MFSYDHTVTMADTLCFPELQSWSSPVHHENNRKLSKDEDDQEISMKHLGGEESSLVTSDMSFEECLSSGRSDPADCLDLMDEGYGSILNADLMGRDRSDTFSCSSETFKDTSSDSDDSDRCVSPDLTSLSPINFRLKQSEVVTTSTPNGLLSHRHGPVRTKPNPVNIKNGLFNPVNTKLICEGCKREDREVVVECMECETKLCIRCREKHQSNDKTHDHTLLITLNNDSEELSAEEEVNLQSNQEGVGGHSGKCYGELCPLHPGVSRGLYCEVCRCVICVLCRVSDHVGHSFTSIAAAQSRVRGSSRRMNSRMQRKMTKVRSQIQELKAYEENLVYLRRQAEQELRERREQLHQTIDNWYHDRSMKINSEFCQETRRVDKIRDKLECHEEKIQEIINEIQKVMEKNKEAPTMENSIDEFAEKVLGAHENTVAKTKEYLDGYTMPKFEHLCFVLLEGSGIDADAMGNVTVKRITDNSQAPTLINSGQLVNSFHTRNQNMASLANYMATGLCVTKSDLIMIGDLGMDRVSFFNQDGNMVSLLDTLPHEDDPLKPVIIKHMGQSVVAVSCKNDVKLFNMDGSHYKDLNLNVESPRGLTVNSHGDLIICDRTAQGHVIHTFSSTNFSCKSSIVGGKRAPSFKSPWYITVDGKNNIVVSDYEDHCVKIFSPRGEILHEFGSKGSRGGQFFHPAGVCVDQHGHLLVADCANDRVQMFSGSGEFLGVVIGGQDSPIVGPVDVALDSQRNLVVLCENGEVKIYKYIH